MFKSKEISESGRSMVEMLGVLAIVGVLSVGGIAGYTTAMNMHKTNEAINNANRLAALIAGRRMLDSNALLDAEDLAGTNFVMKEDATQIVLELSGLSDTVRDKIAAMDLGNAHADNADGKITFTFSNDLSPLGTADFNAGDPEQQQGTQTPADPCAGYDVQCCNNGDISSTAACNYNGGTGNGKCSNGQCVNNPCYNYIGSDESYTGPSVPARPICHCPSTQIWCEGVTQKCMSPYACQGL